MRIAVLHNAVSDSSSPDEQDVLVQVETVCRAAVELGHEAIPISCGINLEDVRSGLEKIHPDMVFNLVESLNGHGNLIHVVPCLLDALRIPYTGALSGSIHITSHKILAKKRLLEMGIPTPAWIGPVPRDMLWNAPRKTDGAWIIKSVWEHASFGMDENAVISASGRNDLLDRLRQCAPLLGGYAFAEQYIDGREFNLALLAGPDGPEILPPAEIRFEKFPPDMPRIVGYRAKWDEQSFEYTHTPRCFDFPSEDAELVSRMKTIAMQSWRAFDLRGYARVDFRVDPHGEPWVLEINANPCLSPDAGFAAAMQQAGVTYADALGRILSDALNRRTENAAMFSRAGSPPEPDGEYRFRFDVTMRDAERIGELVKATGFFNPMEIDVAVELVKEQCDKGDASGYFFVVLERNGVLVGYSCYGQVPLTESGFDIYWAAVHPDLQGKGLGRRIMAETERRIREMGGKQMYIETSGRPQYDPTRAFHVSCGFSMIAEIRNFYAENDSKCIYLKRVQEES